MSWRRSCSASSSQLSRATSRRSSSAFAAESVRRSNTLSVRAQLEGGPVAAQVRWDGSDRRSQRTRLVILVHGFNNSAAEASTSYGSMIDQLHRGLPAGGVTRLGPIWEFHWPGD